MLKVLYLLNFAGKAGTERYVETLVKYLSTDGLVQPFFAYNEGGLLVERLGRALPPGGDAPPLRQKGRP